LRQSPIMFSLIVRPPPASPPFPYTTLFRSRAVLRADELHGHGLRAEQPDGDGAVPRAGRRRARPDRGEQRQGHLVEPGLEDRPLDRKSTRLNSSHVKISYAVFCLKKKKNKK